MRVQVVNVAAEIERHATIKLPCIGAGNEGEYRNDADIIVVLLDHQLVVRGSGDCPADVRGFE
jgi:hypothetical protein